eukprot:384336_1
MSTLDIIILTLKIKLRGGPLRKVTIPDFYKFSHLHELMVHLFEWDDGHLHRFELPQEPDLSALPDRSDPLYDLISRCMTSNDNYKWVSNPMSFLRTGDKEEENESNVRLSSAFKQVGDSVGYEYDFGDSWRVQIDLVNLEAKTVRKSRYSPGIKIVGGRGKTIPEYGRDGGTAYNRDALNRSIANVDELIYYPSDVDWDSEEEEDEDDDIKRNVNSNKTKKSVLGKRKRESDNSANKNKKQRL